MNRSLLFVVALATALAVSVAADDHALNCAKVEQPMGNMDYYQPPEECIGLIPQLKTCTTDYTACIANASACSDAGACIRSRTSCIDNLGNLQLSNTSNTSNCVAWNEGLSNALLYISVGGMYNGSVLQTSCEYTACQLVSDLNTTFNGSSSCPVVTEDVCIDPLATPAPATPAPVPLSQLILYKMTLAGNYTPWLIDETKKQQLNETITEGLGKLFNISKDAILVADLEDGSLVISFYVTDPSAINDEAIQSILRAALADQSIIQNAFAAVAALTGIPIELLGFSVVDPNAPTPVPRGSPVTDEGACGSGCVAGVVVGIIAFIVILAVIIVFTLKKRTTGTGTKNEPTDASHA